MKKIGYMIISLGFLAGALVSVLEVRTIHWGYFLAAVVLGAVGIVIVRVSDKQESQAEGKLAANIQDLESSLSRIVENTNKLNEEKAALNPYDALHRIDQLFPDDLNTFVEARESISHVYGLQAYADVMSDFAAGERYLNRVWSASADGYIDEVKMYLEKAHIQFSEALAKLRQLKVEV